MRLQPTTRLSSAARHRAGFTLAEVLAALVFMAIVIPVTVDAVRVASRAGQVGHYKAVAMRHAERVMNELQATGLLGQTSQSGLLEENGRQYEWQVSTEAWEIDTMDLVTVQVFYTVQGQELSVQLSTLVDSAGSSATSFTTSTP